MGKAIKKANLFDGDSYYALFAQATYKRLISRKWFAYADIMADYEGKQLTCNVSKCNNYGELKKAFLDIRQIINEKAGGECFATKGNNRGKKFLYIGADDDPLADMRNAKVINDLRQYWRFCQDSAGFFPTSWLEYFFRDCRDLIDIKAKRQKGEQVLSASLDRMLTNIDLLPMLYEAITHKQVLSIDYKPYGEESRPLVFHPQYLKEYNGRWHLLGHADNELPEFGYNVALDRIDGRPRELVPHDYVSAPAGFYEQFFNDIVGVSRHADAKVETIRVRAHSLYVFKLTETKIIHHTQETVIPFGQHADGEYGEFEIKVEVNNELIGRILQMGAGLEVMAPAEVRETFRQRVEKLAKRYEQ